jgi:hypothetical protein
MTLNVYHFNGGRLARLLSFVALALGLQAQMVPERPVEDFSLHGFDENTGWLLWRLSGREAHYLSAEHIRVRGMILTNYHGEESQSNPVTIASPLADLFPQSGRAEGDSPLRVLGPGYSIEGEQWAWDAQNRKLEIRRRPVVTFEQSMTNLLR